ncbi:MAG: response regulator [Methylococcales bacterium]
MNSLFQKTISPEQNQDDSEQIGIHIQGIPALEVSKLIRILQLSATRKRRYVNVNSADQAAIVITTEQNPIVKDHQVVVTYGKQPSVSLYHLQPPLMSIRVLRMLDGIELNSISQTETTVTPEAQNTVLDKYNKVDQFTSKVTLSVPVTNAAVTNNGDNLSYRILIVDDSVLIHKALDIELAKAPFVSNKDYAESGEDCLTLINQNQYDMIFLDVMMPGIDGFETCAKIRKIASYKKVPIIMLSAKTSPLDEVKGVMAGCTTYLTKPIKHDAFQKLLGRMGNWLENYKTA